MHNIEYFTYPKAVNKAKVQKDLDNYVAHEDWQEGCTGLYHNIRWLDNKIYDTPEEAHKALEELDRGNYDQIAVLYQNSHTPDDAKMKELNQKLEIAYSEYQRRDRLLYSQIVTSAFIGCKTCGSRLARKFMTTNKCPVCHAEMRPDHMMKSISSAKNKWDRAQREVKEYIRKKGKKEILWLVKIEYHT